MTAPTLTPVTCPVCGIPWDRDAGIWPDDTCPDHEPESVGTWDPARLARWAALNNAPTSTRTAA